MDGASCSGDAAVRDVVRLQPDIVLPDVQMPGTDGFEVVEALTDTVYDARMPFITFVTAYEEYAVRVFEVTAIECVRKPVSRARLDQAVGPAVERLEFASWSPSWTSARETAYEVS